MWHEGTIKIGRSIFQYLVKHYDDPSHFVIGNGRISKLMLKRNGRIVYNYDRGEDTKAIDSDTEKALAILIRDYN